MKHEIRFVTGEAALTAGRVLVVSDLHMGIEHRYRKRGIALPSQSEKLITRLESLIRKTRTKRLVILGDVKHKVPGTSFQEEREIPAFFRRLMEKVDVGVAPGNHDGGIEKLLPPGVKLYPGSGFRVGDAWLCHGHAWPVEEFLDCREVVIGHNHASIEFRDDLGYRWREPVWIRAVLERKMLAERFRGLDAKRGHEAERGLPEVVLMPAFNGFAGLVPANRSGKGFERHFMEGPSPLFRAAKRDSARVHMLDGTFLGELGKL